MIFTSERRGCFLYEIIVCNKKRLSENKEEFLVVGNVIPDI